MKKIGLAFLGSLLLAFPLAAGVVFEIEVTDHESSPPKAESMQASVEGRNLKMGIAAGQAGKDDGEVVFNGATREMVILDHGGKSYFVVDEEAMKSITEQISGVMSQLQEALKNVPEDQREMVEKMMKERMPQAAAPTDEGPKRELRKTSERAEKNGYPCVKYEVLFGGNKVRELWVTPWSKVDGGEEAAGAFKDMASFFAEMVETLTAAAGDVGNPFGDVNNNPFEFMQDFDGFPVVTREFGDDGSLENEASLRSAKRRQLDPADFEPPAGYKRQSMPGF